MYTSPTAPEAALLERLGLTPSEARVYLALIDLGPSKASAITRAANVASSKTYELLDRLIAKGLVATHDEEGTRRFAAAAPERLSEYAQERAAELSRVQSDLNHILPSLSLRFEERMGESEVELFKGYRGVETVFREILRALKPGEEYLVAGGGDTPSENPRTMRFFERFHKERAAKGIVFRFILSDKRRAQMKRVMLAPHTLMRHVPYTTPSTMNIYADTVFLLVMSPVPAAIRIRDKRIAASYRRHFEELWRRAKR